MPSEAEMRKTVAAMVGEESADTVHLAAFLTIAKKLLLDRRYATYTHATTPTHIQERKT